MNRTALRTFAAVACSAALALSAGCGGDDDTKDDTKSSSTLTVEEFKTQANAICKAQDAAEAESFGAAQEAVTSGDQAATQEALEKGVAVIRGEADAIGALAAPDEIKAEVEALVTSLNAALDKVAQDGVSAVPGLADPSAKAQALGLPDCGN